MVGAAHAVAWLFKLEDDITNWTSTHVLLTILAIIGFLIFSWFMWDVARFHLRDAVNRVMRGQPLRPVDVEALESQVDAGSDLETD